MAQARRYGAGQRNGEAAEYALFSCGRGERRVRQGSAAVERKAKVDRTDPGLHPTNLATIRGQEAKTPTSRSPLTWPHHRTGVWWRVACGAWGIRGWGQHGSAVLREEALLRQRRQRQLCRIPHRQPEHARHGAGEAD